MILENLASVLSTDQEIIDYCDEKWTKAHRVYIGYNREDPPSYNPAFLIGETQIAEIKDGRKKWQVIIGVVTKGDVEPHEIGNIFALENYINTEELREIAIKAIERNQHKFGKLEFDGGTIEESLMPLYASLIGLLIEDIHSMRG